MCICHLHFLTCYIVRGIITRQLISKVPKVHCRNGGIFNLTSRSCSLISASNSNGRYCSPLRKHFSGKAYRTGSIRQAVLREGGPILAPPHFLSNCRFTTVLCRSSWTVHRDGRSAFTLTLSATSMTPPIGKLFVSHSFDA